MSGIRIKDLQSAAPIIDESFDNLKFVVDSPDTDSTLNMSGAELKNALGANDNHTHDIEDVLGLEQELSDKLDKSGGVIDGDLSISGDLQITGTLHVPEVVFNRIDTISGEQWAAVGFGTIESIDVENQIVTVKLLDGELLSSHVGDICRGTFHNLLGASSDEDGNGFLRMKGFATSYFTPTELLPDGKSFRYELQPDTTFHPCKAMKFVCYGSFVDKTRQASAYSTRTYKRYLSGVNTWVIDPNKHIMAQFGDIDGLTIGGVTMKGHGSFQKNMYMTGVHIQFTPEQLEDIKGNDAYNVSLSTYEGVVKLSADGSVPDMTKDVNVVTEGENVVTGDKNVVTQIYSLTTRIQAFKGDTELFFSTLPTKGAYNVTLSPHGCDAVVSAGVLTVLNITNTEDCYVEMAVNCEGNAIFIKRYSITFVVNGDKGDDGEDAITAVIYSTNGNCFINGDVSTVLKMAVFKGIEDITSTFEPNRFIWKRISDNPDTDVIWNEQHEGIGPQIEIDGDDVYKKALFDCEII